MRCVWQQTSPDRIEIHATPRPVLMLFGLPFLGIGLWLGWNVVGALMDVVTRKVTFMDDIFAFTLLPVFALLFLWPGVLLVLARKRWVIDGITGQALETTDVLFKSWSHKHALSDFKAVRAYQGKEDSRNVSELPSEEDIRRYTVPQPYCVDLVPQSPKGKSPTVGVTKDAVDAILLGKALAALTKLPLVNDTAKDGEDYEEEGLRYDAGPSGEAG